MKNLIKSFKVTNGGWHNNVTTFYGELNNENKYIYIPEYDLINEYDSTTDTRELLKLMYNINDEDDTMGKVEDFNSKHQINVDNKELETIQEELDNNYITDGIDDNNINIQ